MSEQIRRIYEFGPFVLDPAERTLLRDRKPVPLTPKAFDTLLVLIKNQSHMLEKKELIEILWPGSFVEEGNLTQNIAMLRRALGDGHSGSRYIETLPKHGYRFIAEVKVTESAALDLTIQKRSRTHVVIKKEREESTDFTDYADYAKNDAATRGRGDSVRWGHSPRLRVAVSLLAVSVLVVSVVGAYVWSSRTSKNAASLSSVKSIAVLPFKQISPTDSEDYLGVGMADTLISRLGHLKQISVRPARAVQNYNGSGQRDLMAIGRELNVDAVLDGQIQRSNGRMRVTVQLVSARDGAAFWAETFDEEFKDIFALQDAITERVTRQLVPVLTKQEKQQLAKRYTDNPAAYEAYLKGRYFWNKRTTEGIHKGIEYFQEAVDKDPNFALGYVGLTDAYLIDNQPKAEFVLRKALQLEDTLGEAHASSGFNSMFWHWAWGDAEREFKLAVELSPNYATAHQWYANYLAAMGRLDEAKAEMQRALELDPLSPNMHADLGQVYYFAHEYDQAITECRKALEIDPDFLFAHQYLFAAYPQTGRYNEAVDEFLKWQTQDGRTPATVASFRNAYAKSGWPGFLRAWIQLRKENPSSAAAVYAKLGDKERAIEQLGKAYDERDFFLVFIKVEPMYDNLRSDPRFQELLRRMKLAP